jgi:diguanylate cyclase (GGDEF)-like protein
LKQESPVKFRQKLTVRVSISSILVNQGYDVHCVNNGTMALKTIALIHPDLVLLDIKLPDLTGYEICKKLHENNLTKDISILFMSGLNDVQDKIKGFEVGGLDYITKPFQIEEVLIRVQTQLQIRKEKLKLQKENDNLKIAAHLDSLTQVANRRRFDEYLEEQWEKLKLEQDYLSLVMCDVDYFKLYNDTYGHLAGDKCLKHIAQTISKSLFRSIDLVARYGGEEFVILLPNTDLQNVLIVVKRIQKKLENLAILHEQSAVNKYVSLSFGIISIIPNDYITPLDVLNQADQRLYHAKSQGRNCYSVNELYSINYIY